MEWANGTMPLMSGSMLTSSLIPLGPIWLLPQYSAATIEGEELRERTSIAMIIDCHTHIGAPAHFSAAFTEAMTTAWGEMSWPEDDQAAHWRMVSEVDRAIVLALDAPATGIVVPNDYVAGYVDIHPEKLIGFASVDPNRPDALERLDHAVDTLGLRGLKVSPTYQHFDPMSDIALALFRRTERLQLPVLCHQGTTFLPSAPMRWARPFLLDDLARTYPGLTLVIAHLGHPWYEETMAVIRKHQFLFADVSALHTRPLQLYLALRSAVEYRVTEKLFFGSDFPFSSALDTTAALRSVNEIVKGTNFPPIPEDEIERIIHSDALTSLGLD